MEYKGSKKILILFAHPYFEKSRVNTELVKACGGLDFVTFRDLYEIYPDFHIDKRKEQNLLLEHDILILQHPFYWYGCPSILKEWIDSVLESGFAYGEGGDALRGKKMLNVITTGGSRDTYSKNGVHGYRVLEFLKVFERMAVFCGMDYLPPFVVHGTSGHRNDETISRYRELLGETLLRLGEDSIDYDALSKYEYINDHFSQTD